MPEGATIQVRIGRQQLQFAVLLQVVLCLSLVEVVDAVGVCFLLGQLVALSPFSRGQVGKRERLLLFPWLRDGGGLFLVGCGFVRLTHYLQSPQLDISPPNAFTDQILAPYPVDLEADMAGIGHPVELEIGDRDTVDEGLIVIIKHADQKRVPFIHVEGPQNGFRFLIFQIRTEPLLR